MGFKKHRTEFESLQNDHLRRLPDVHDVVHTHFRRLWLYELDAITASRFCGMTAEVTELSRSFR